MVILSTVLKNSNETLKLFKKHLGGKFVDSLRLAVKGGSGGSGAPKYGGIGGAGGSVYVQAVKDITLKDVLKKYKEKKVSGNNGQHSQSRCILGMRGTDEVIEVPTGITVYNEKKYSLGELNEEGERIMVAKGGVGGCPETGFGGMKGQSQVITIDLKLIADVGFVGFPNAGKSTLLAALSRAKPKIASYPFTTIRPNVGVMVFKDGRQITLADLPGLIEGAHCNIGMGHRFLRHVERTKLLLFVVDINGFQLSHKYVPRSFLETIILLNKEIELYKQSLLEKPAILIVNKMDTENADQTFLNSKETLKNLKGFIKNCPEEMRPDNIAQFDAIIPFSALHHGQDSLLCVKETIRNVIDKYYANNDVDMENKLLKSLENKFNEHAEVVV